MPRGITSAATSAPTGGVGATDFTTTATKKAPRRKASYVGKKATIGTDAKFIGDAKIHLDQARSAKGQGHIGRRGQGGAREAPKHSSGLVKGELEAVACFIKGQLERGVFEVGDIVSVDA